MFLCVKTSRGKKVVATCFLYLEVYRWIAGDDPIYRKFSLKVTHSFRKRRFRFRFIVHQPCEQVKKQFNYH